MIDVRQARNAPDRGPIPPQLIGTDRVWDIIVAEYPDQAGSRSLRVSVVLKENTEHEAVLVHGRRVTTSCTLGNIQDEGIWTYVRCWPVR